MTEATQAIDNIQNNKINASHLSQHEYSDFSTFRPRESDDVSPVNKYNTDGLETTKRESKMIPQSPRSREQAMRAKRLKRKTKLKQDEKENIPNQAFQFTQGGQEKGLKLADGKNNRLGNEFSTDRDSSFARNSTIYSISSQNKLLNHEDPLQGPNTWSSIREEFARGHYNDFLNSHNGMNDSTSNKDASISGNIQKGSNNMTRTVSDILNSDKAITDFNVPLEEQEETPIQVYIPRTTTRGQTEMFLMPTVPNVEAERVVPASSRQVNQVQDQNIPQLSEYAVKAYIRRNIMYFAFTTAISTLIVLMAHSFVSLQSIFNAFYLYMLYIIIERLASNSIRRDGEPWLRNEDLLTAWTAACGIASLAILNMKITRVLPNSTFALIPLLIATVSYFSKSKAPVNLKKRQTLIGLACTVQAFMIGLKLDGVIDFDWRFVFTGCWFYAGMISMHFIGNILFLAFLLLVLVFRKRQIRICREELLGLVWNCIYYARTVSDFLVVFACIEAFGPANDLGLMQIAPYVNMGLSMVGILYGIGRFQDIMKFLQPRLSKSYLSEVQISSPSEISEPILSINVEKKQTYFVKMSSTYFIPLDSSLSLKNIEKIKRIRDLFKSFRTNKGNSQERLSTQPDKDFKLVAVDMLHRFKERINKKTEDRNEEKPRQDLKSARNSDFRKINIEEDKEASKLYLSADNIDKIIEANADNVTSVPDEHKGEEGVCYLCFDSKSDAVLMDCGHSGVCYECAIAIVKSRKECMECRADIKAVYKIDPTPKVLDIVKGFEVSHVIIKQQPSIVSD